MRFLSTTGSYVLFLKNIFSRFEKRKIYYPKIIDEINEYIDKGTDGFPKRKYSDKIRSLDWNGIKDND